MRPTAWMSFLAVFFLAAAGCNSRGPTQARPAPVAHDPLASWVVTGDWMTTEEEAVQDALDKAQGKVNEYLRAQQPPMTWPSDRKYIQQNLLRPLRADDSGFKALLKKADDPGLKALAKGADWQGENVRENLVSGQAVQVETRPFDDLGIMRRAALRLEISAANQKEFQKQEEIYQAKQRNDRATARQWWVVRILAGLVALLTAVTFYLRLEDATKGYYTTLLRAAAVAFVTLVGAALWLLT
ncbi:MAG TPA: hypothetical protein VKA46_24120 [Gemmataceae bacterium]|nr:hypothetical protein [Gemmataceae bacterium]